MEENKSIYNMHYPFEIVPLPYAYNAMEPYIDEETMHLHHDKHLQTYINNLNATLKDYPKYHNLSLIDLLLNVTKLPQEIQVSVCRNAGGVFNHFFYFEQLINPNEVPSGKILQLIERDFGSFDNFKKQFADAATAVFGSGYAWLVIDNKHKLQIVTTKNQRTPLNQGLYPLLNIDVWEHAYYLKYHNVRADYINNYFNIINWKVVEDRLNSI